MTRAFALCFLAMAATHLVAQSQPSEVWTFDRIDRIGGHPTTVLGNPRVVNTPIGKAVEFDGVDDALFVDVHPLAGAETFTWEAIFRPDGGAAEQRWFHLQESGSENRMLFEIRVVGDKWYLDSYLHGNSAQKALIDRTKLHPVGAWYHVACVYDGREFRNYVNGVLQTSDEMPFTPQGPGRTSIGVRINLVNYFKGAIQSARFTRRARSPAEFAIPPAFSVPSVGVRGQVRTRDRSGTDRRSGTGPDHPLSVRGQVRTARGSGQTRRRRVYRRNPLPTVLAFIPRNAAISAR